MNPHWLWLIVPSSVTVGFVLGLFAAVSVYDRKMDYYRRQIEEWKGPDRPRFNHE